MKTTGNGIKDKIFYLVKKVRVMTLAVSKNNIPWSSPVYFVFHNKKFYFFSNENARHIHQAKQAKAIAASVFHDSDKMDEIFGLQMSGELEKITSPGRYSIVAKNYLEKFDFLKQISEFSNNTNTNIIETGDLFTEIFKSRLYCFRPDLITMSDKAGKTKIKLKSKDFPA